MDRNQKEGKWWTQKTILFPDNCLVEAEEKLIPGSISYELVYFSLSIFYIF